MQQPALTLMKHCNTVQLVVCWLFNIGIPSSPIRYLVDVSRESAVLPLLQEGVGGQKKCNVAPTVPITLLVHAAPPPLIFL